MATEFSELYSQFITVKSKDINFATVYKPDYLSSFLYRLLLDGRQKFRDLVVELDSTLGNQMEDVVESTRTTYDYTFTGATDTRELVPNPTSGSSFYVTVNDVIWTDYSFNATSNEMTISNAPTTGTNTVYVGAYYDGQFNQTLNLTEKGLLVDFMQLAYIDSELVDEMTLNMGVYGKEYKMYSQANHIKQVQEMYDQKYWRLRQRVIMYTYRQDTDDLDGLGGSAWS